MCVPTAAELLEISKFTSRAATALYSHVYSSAEKQCGVKTIARLEAVAVNKIHKYKCVVVLYVSMCSAITMPVFMNSLHCSHHNVETTVKIIKNEVRCRDDTVPKTVDTRRHCKVGLRACNNLPQPRKTKGLRKIVACSQPYLAVLSSEFLARYIIPTSYFIFNDFYTCFTHFFQP